MSRIRSRLSFANVVSVLALFIALGGSATAAVLITGKNVKDGTLTGKDIKNSSLGSADIKDGNLLAKDFKAGQLPAGAQGPQGPQGLKGDKGDKGDKGNPGTNGVDGAIGPSDAYTASGGLPQTISVPAGVYFVTAKAVNSGATVASQTTRCDLTGGSSSDIAFGRIDQSSHTQETLAAMMVTSFAAPGTLTWSCTGTNITVTQPKLQAVKVQTLH